MRLVQWAIDNKDSLLTLAAYVVAGSALLVNLIPTLKENSKILAVIKFLGRLGLQKYGPTKRP